jgi:ABC-2 type transport system permease protein
MPLHDVGYRRWDGQRTSQMSRFWIITETGVRLASKSRWVRRMLFFAWLPVMYWGVGFFVIERALVSDSNIAVAALEDLNAPQPVIDEARRQSKQIDGRSKIAQTLRSQFKMIPKVDELANGLETGDDEKTRNIVWSWLLMTFFRYPQALLILFLIGTIAPALISRDLRSRAFLLYFSRPIGKFEYIFGKLCIPMAFITFVTTLPALALYLFAVMVSPDLSVIWSTWDIPFRIVGATIALVIPTASLALMLSSLTQESRFASFAWFAIWALGHGAWLAILFATAIQFESAPFDPQVINSSAVQNWSVLSLYNNLGDIQSWIFGFGDFHKVWRGIVALMIISTVSLVVLYRQVSAPIRV